jgi:deoxyribodipyrimidine photo-lyase
MNQTSKIHPPWALHWFRRDLRLAGNSALRNAYKTFNGRVLGVFSFDQVFLSRSDFSHDRFQFFLKTLAALKSELRSQGGDLLVLGLGPHECFDTILSCINKAGFPPPAVISWNRDYEPFARERDQRVEMKLRSLGLSVETHRDHLLVEPSEILNNEGKPFKVYSAFARKWFDLMNSQEGSDRLLGQSGAIKYFESPNSRHEKKLFCLTWDILGAHKPVDMLDEMTLENSSKVNITIPEAGSQIAWRRVKDWGAQLARYQHDRDYPSLDQTSKFSVFLKNGSLTVPLIIAAYEFQGLTFKAPDSATKFLQELVWREFYYYLLWHFPHVETRAFQPKYDQLAWENSSESFEAWKNGLTGYPIVDAAMRQLKTTGWMHNRLRMIVASFLTKDLLIDWRWGERWFMERLLDGDLAPNNGGWQWAAGTGCDAQPYFRIFNPESQSKKFDAEGDFIRKFVPELHSLNPKAIHTPSPDTRKQLGYPDPIVNHAVQRQKALKMFTDL